MDDDHHLTALVGSPGVLALLRRERDNPTLPDDQHCAVLELYSHARHLPAREEAPAGQDKPPVESAESCQHPNTYRWGGFLPTCCDCGAEM